MRGSDVHDEARDYIIGAADRFPPAFARFRRDVESLRRRYRDDPAQIAVEEEWGFTRSWNRADWFDWNNCWLRVKIDVIYLDDSEVVIIDWKSGKFRDDDQSKYLAQLDLYALAALIVFTKQNPVVRPKLCYIDLGKTYSGPSELAYSLKDLPKLKQSWDRRVRTMMNDRTFLPRPNRYCYNCHFRKSNADNGGGQCIYE